MSELRTRVSPTLVDIPVCFDLMFPNYLSKSSFFQELFEHVYTITIGLLLSKDAVQYICISDFMKTTFSLFNIDDEFIRRSMIFRN